MQDYFHKQKDQIHQFLQQYMDESSHNPIITRCQGQSVLKDILDFTSGGKMIRGALVRFSYGLFQDGESPNALSAAGAALELLQSALLIHDDIMDSDEKRRGMATLYFQYQLTAREAQWQNPDHSGISLGICAGDIAFFLAFHILQSLNLPSEVLEKIQRLVSQEMIYVGMAQMKDIQYGVQAEEAEKEKILHLYRYKTGRYTFSLPLMLGAIIAGEGNEILDFLGELGEEIGIVFQIKDDEIGLLGEEKKIGKPVGSDIAEGKRTLIRKELFERCNAQEKEELEVIFGDHSIGESEVSRVRELLYKYQIPERMKEENIQRIHDIEKKIHLRKDLKDHSKKQLQALLDYNLKRDY